jgi:hypothetical protein
MASYEEPPLPFGTPAYYREQELLLYQGNPWIEALPPIYSEPEVNRLLEYVPSACREMASGGCSSAHSGE